MPVFVPHVADTLTLPDITVSNFRDILPEFADSSKYLDETIVEWVNIATSVLDQKRWTSYWRLGVSLFVAHNLVLSARNAQLAQRGLPGGVSGGMISSKSMGGVSVSYDATSFSLDKGGDWNLTTYGVRFLNMARMIGSGGVQVSGGPPPFPVMLV